ncbi:Nn.00g011430.m01.CDS01 [Neocucurbitaria sp. VM-36]
MNADSSHHALVIGASGLIAFKENSDHEREVEINIGMMRRVVRAVKILLSNFKFFVYPGGTRGYGIYRPYGIFSAPLVKEMADELPQDYLKTVAYPHYRAMLTAESTNEDWSWSELVPEAIIGFTPNGFGFSLAGHWAVYLSTYRLVHGEGAEVPFPGTMKGYDSLYSETSATTSAKRGSSMLLNSATPESMRVRWPQIASFFGLKGVPPPPTASASDAKPSDFIKQHQERWKETGMKGVDIWNAAQLDSYGHWLTFDRHLSLKRLRDAGFDEERRPEEGWWEAFELFRRAGMIQ